MSPGEEEVPAHGCFNPCEKQSVKNDVSLMDGTHGLMAEAGFPLVPTSCYSLPYAYNNYEDTGQNL